MKDIVIYQTEDNQFKVAVQTDGETVWLNQQQMAGLFDQTKQNISLHINNCFNEGELQKESTVKESLTVQTEGKRQIKRKIEYYNLDVIISVGYRVKSKRGTQFRIWANKILKEYLIKGYNINQERLKKSEQNLNSLKQSIQLLNNVVEQRELSTDEATGLLKIVSEYAQALDLLDQYDHQRLVITDQQDATINKLAYTNAVQQINNWRTQQEAGKLDFILKCFVLESNRDFLSEQSSFLSASRLSQDGREKS